MNKRIAVLLGACFLSFVPNFFITFVHGDEGGWLHLSRYLWSGELYSTVTDTKPPLHFLYYWLFSAGGESMLLLRVCTSLWIWAGALSLYKLCEKYFSAQAAWFVSLTFCLSIGLIENGAVSCERIYLPLIIWATSLSLLHSSFASASLAGALIAVAFLIKQPAIILGAVSLLGLFRYRFSKIAWLCFAWISGFAALLILTLIILPQTAPQIWQESFVENFTYIASNAPGRGADIRQNFFAAVFWYGPLILATLLWVTLGMRRNLKWKNAQMFWTVAWVTLSFATLAVGSRFYQTYYLNILPVLVVGAGLFVSSCQRRTQKIALGVTLLWLMIGHGFTIYKQINDKNWAWDSQVRHLVQEIETRTQPSDKIWILNSIQPAYAASHRTPAVKHVYFHQTLGHIDLCLTEESALRERLDLPNYQRLLSDLEQTSPAFVFWTQRAKNTCSHRLLLENFPSLKNFIESNYTLAFESPLGRAFVRK